MIQKRTARRSTKTNTANRSTKLGGSSPWESVKQTTMKQADTIRDPITGAPRAHPVGTGAAIGAGCGTLAPEPVTLAPQPVGTAAGGAICALLGGLGGKAAARYEQLSGNSPLDREHAGQATRAGWDRPDVAATGKD
jgi:hypothetical protein